MSSRLFQTTLAALLIAVANARGSARAERLAHAVPPAALAPEIDEAALPSHTPDGRVVPRSRRAQFENAFQKLHNRGQLPRCADVAPATAKLIGAEIAALNQGHGCWATIDYLARATNRCPTQIRLVCAYLEAQGWQINLSRVAADDRCIGDAARPVTRDKSTVRCIFPVPIGLAETLSDDEILDLIAYGERKPVAVLPGGAPAPALAPAVSPPPPPPRRDTSSLQPMGKWRPASPASVVRPDGGALDAPIAELAELTGHTLAVGWVISTAAEYTLDIDHVVDALRELAAKLRKEQAGVVAMDKRPRKVSAEELCGRVDAYLGGKRAWLDRGGEQAMLRDEARDREEDYRAAHKSPEQLERESGRAVRYEAPEPPPPRPTAEQKARLAIALEGDPATRAALSRELDERLRRIAEEADPAARGRLERLLEDSIRARGS